MKSSEHKNNLILATSFLAVIVVIALTYLHLDKTTVSITRPLVVNAICAQLGQVRNIVGHVGKTPDLSGAAMQAITDPAIAPVVQRYRRIDDASFAVVLMPEVASDYPDIAAELQRLSTKELVSGQLAFCAHLATACPVKGLNLNVEDGNVYVNTEGKRRRATPDERQQFFACSQR